MRKYSITDITRQLADGRLVYRIVANCDFGPVRKGEFGGFIEHSENLSQSGLCWIGNHAAALEDSKVTDDAMLMDYAIIHDGVYLTGESYVGDTAELVEHVFVAGHACIMGSTFLAGAEAPSARPATDPDGEGMYQSFLQDAKIVNPHVRLIGLTATPFRLKSGMLCGPDNLLHDICFEVGVKQLIDENYLCRLKTKSGRAKVDCSLLGIRAGEFIASEVDELMNQDELVASACREIIIQTENRHSVLIFAASVSHAGHVKATLEKMSGLECGLVTGETSATQRERIIKRFKREPVAANLFGECMEPLKYLVNVNVLTTGFDAPNVDSVVLLRPTASPGLYYQMLGRGFRLHESKQDCLVLDYGGNILRHGPVDCIRIKEKSHGGSGDTPMKECPNCQMFVHAAVAVCPECGYAFPPPEKEKHDATASQEGVLSGEVIDTEYPVREVYYAVHTKKGADDFAPKTVRVDYRIGFSDYKSEWLCPEHDGWARNRFEKWWTARSNEELPDSAEEAVEIASMGGLAETRSITVRKIAGEKYDRIIRYEVGDKPEPVNWNVDAFGEPAVPSQYASHSNSSPPDGRLTPTHDEYDDVPF